MNLETITTIFKQKQLLLINMMDLTKRIEVQARDDDDELQNSIDSRLPLIERVQKCNLAVTHCLEDEENLFTKEEKERINSIANNSFDKNADYSQEEKELIEIVTANEKTLATIISINKRIDRILKKKSDELKIELGKNRSKQEDEMFF